MSYKWVDKLLLLVAVILAITYCLIGAIFLLERYFAQDLNSQIPKIEQALYKNTGLKWDISELDVEWKGLNPVISVGRLTALRSEKEFKLDETSFLNRSNKHVLDTSPQFSTGNTVVDLRNGSAYIDILASLFSRELRLHELEVENLIMRLSNVNGQWFLFKAKNDQAGTSNFIDFIYHLRFAELGNIGFVVDYFSNPQDSATIGDQLSLINSEVLPAIKIQLRRVNKNRQFSISHASEATKNTKNRLSDSLDKTPEVSVSASSEPELNEIKQELISSVKLPPSENFMLSGWTKNTHTNNEFALSAYVNSGSQASVKWINTFIPGLGVDIFDTELWIAKKSGDDAQWKWKINNITANVERSNIEPPSAKGLALQNVVLGVQQNLSGIATAVWNTFPFTFDGKVFEVPDGVAELLFDTNHLMDVSVSTAELDLQRVKDFVVETQLLPDKYLDIIRVLDPRGKLSELSFRLPDVNPSAFRVSGQLHNASITPRKNTPGGDHISGKFELSASSGFIDVASNDAFKLLLPEVYDQPLSFSSVFGRVAWEIHQDRFFVFGNNIQAVSDDARAELGASFEVNGRMKGDESNYMRLEIGVMNSRVEDLLAYIPHTVPISLSNWIAQSKAVGEVMEGGFIYNGSLRANESQYRNIQVYADVIGTSLQFHSDWSGVSNISGLVLVSEAQTTAKIIEGSVGELMLRDATVTVNTAAAQKQGIAVDLALTGETGDLITLLQDSPVGKNINSVIGNWSSSGSFSQGIFSLTAPLQEISSNNVDVDFTARLESARLNMKNFDLLISDIKGPIRYSTESGLSSKGISAVLWDQPIDLTIGQYGSAGNQGSNEKPDASRLKINSKGRVDAENLFRWLEQPVVGFAKGITDFDLMLDYGENHSQLHISSNLNGVALSAPAPFYKSALSSKLFEFNWAMNTHFQPMNIQLGNEAALKFAYEDFKFLGGTVLLKGPNNQSIQNFLSSTINQIKSKALFAEGGVTFTGELDYLNLEEWRKAVDNYERFDKRLSGLGHVRDSENSSFNIWGKNLEIARAILFDKEIEDLVASFSEQDQRWSFQIESDLFKGLVQLPIATTNHASSNAKAINSVDKLSDTDENESGILGMPVIPDYVVDEERIIVDLDYLRLSPQDINSNTNSIKEFEESFLRPEGLASMKVNIDQFYIGPRDFGQWRFLLTTGDNTALIHDIKGSAFSLELFSDADDGLLWAEDNLGALTTSLNLQVGSSDFGRFLKLIQKENEELPMVSEELNADLSLSWLGAPDAMTIAGLTGDVDFEFGRGRFFQASQSATGLLKILGLINFDTLVRRIQLDFADIYKEGLSFDKITGQFHLDQNRIEFFDKPIEVKAPASKFSMLGAVNLENSTIDADLVATLPVANNLPWIAALAGGLPVAAGTFIVTRVFGDQFEKFSQANYHIGGSLDDPQVTFDRVFDDVEPNSNKTGLNQEADSEK